MKTDQQYYNESTPLPLYMENMSQLKEESFSIYESFVVPTGDGFIEKLSNANVHILAITEDWCGDAMVNNPIIRKVAEAANVEVRTFLRDADTDLIDRYLTNGGRGIPIYLILNEAGEVIAKWGPRAPELQQFVMDGRAELPAQDDPSFEEAQKTFYTNLRQRYVEDTTFWTYIYKSFKDAVEKAL